MSSAVPIAIVIVSGVAYHLAQKGASGANPWPLLVIAYGVALVATLSIAAAAGGPLRWQAGRVEWTAGLVIGLAAVGIEAGFFFIYRAGWSLGSVSVIANLAVASTLALAGVALFGEQLSATRLAGLALAALGAALITRG